MELDTGDPAVPCHRAERKVVARLGLHHVFPLRPHVVGMQEIEVVAGLDPLKEWRLALELELIPADVGYRPAGGKPAHIAREQRQSRNTGSLFARLKKHLKPHTDSEQSGSSLQSLAQGRLQPAGAQR